MTARVAIGRDPVRLVLAAVCAVPCGLAVGLRPTEALLITLVAIGLITCALLPVRHLPVLLLAITLIVPSLVLEGLSGSGQSRAVTLIAALTLARLLVSRLVIVGTAVLWLAVATTLGLTLMTSLIATAQPPGAVGSNADLVRDLTLPLAAFVGLAGGAQARSCGRRLTVPRWFGWLGLMAALASVGFWAWEQLHLGVFDNGLFQHLAASSSFGKRSVFPFVEDSPNTAAVMFVLICAFVAPPLLLAGRKHDRAFGIVLVVGSLAGVLSTQSRTGLSAAGAAAVTYLILVKRGGGRRSTALITLVVLISAGAYVFGTFPAERASDDTLQSRAQIWRQGAQTFLQEPILGHGFRYAEKNNFVEPARAGGVSLRQSMHSDILSNLDDGGVIGATLFVVVLGLMFRTARRSVADPSTRPLGIGYSCMLVAMVTSGLDNTLSDSAAVITFIWLAFGVMIGCSGRPSEARGALAPELRPASSWLPVGAVHRPLQYRGRRVR